MVPKSHKLKRIHRKQSPRSSKGKSNPLYSLLIYVVIILIIAVLIYISYTAVLPQLASIFTGSESISTTGANATKTLIKVVYIKD